MFDGRALNFDVFFSVSGDGRLANGMEDDLFY